MADVKISDIVLGSPLETDDVELQRGGGGASLRASLKDIRDSRKAAGEAHSTADYTMSGVTTSPTPVIGYDVSEVDDGITVTLTADSGSNRASFTVDAAKADVYNIDVSIEAESNKSENIDVILYKNAVATSFKAGINLSNANIDSGSASISAMMNLDVGDLVEVYINTDGSTMDILIDSISFRINRAS